VPRILVLQHHEYEHPGTFRDFLAADGIAWDAVRLDAGEAIPGLAGYAGLIVMGGPQDVWEEDRFPWLAAEKAAIREAVAARGLPYLGVCLGHQLLASALGGEVAAMKGKAEICVGEVALTAAGERDPLLGGDGHTLSCLQWHAAEVTVPPPDAVILAENRASRVQAMRWGERAYGLQFHVEAGETTVPEWAGIPAYRRALERGLGPGELERFAERAREMAPAFRARAQRLYRRFTTLLAKVEG